jgi:hypothetical protein
MILMVTGPWYLTGLLIGLKNELEGESKKLSALPLCWQVEIVVFIYKTFLGIKCLPSVQYKQNYVKISINFTLDTIPKGLQVATK